MLAHEIKTHHAKLAIEKAAHDESLSPAQRKAAMQALAEHAESLATWTPAKDEPTAKKPRR